MSLDIKIEPNRLAKEKSPYLLQHAYNPIDWYSWGNEAFEKAKIEDKPIFLSIGYSTCHWCHVMAHESFEDDNVAELMNTHFIAIKVDKEERPDVDSVYMMVCQALTGSGGWPMTVMMTPDQKPFFAGTYYPKESKYGKPGLINLLNTVAKKWKSDREGIVNTSDKIIEAISEQSNVQSQSGSLSKETIKKTFTLFDKLFDPIYGGFREAPKFPTPHHLMFLLRYYQNEKEEKALEIVEKTLQQMYKGGIFDHVGFGFSRYSTDNKWLAPHFEKMLYDNALLTITYLEAYQVTGKQVYKTVAIKVMDYVVRELVDEDGGFYCAQDADSEGEEGKYYVFTSNEIVKLLGEEDGTYFNKYFDITSTGNFEGKSIINLIQNKVFDKPNEKIDQLTKKVFEYRLTRTYLHKDDKILTSWNALMIVSFAKAYKILQEEKYLKIAKKALDFIEEKLIGKEGRLFATYREGSASHFGYIDDYAFLIWALMEMYEATFKISFLEKAIQLNTDMIHYFWDDQNSGFYLYGLDSESLITRPKELYDGAIPSGNSVAAYNLIKLARLTGDNKLEELADRQLKFYAASTKMYPLGYSFYMMALIFALYPSQEVVCILKHETDAKNIKSIMSEQFMPSLVVLIKDEENEEQINKLIPFLQEYHLVNDKTTYYICKNKTCSVPINDINELKNMIRDKAK